MKKIDIKSLDLEEIKKEIKKIDFREFHAEQIFSWLSKGIEGFDKMTNISLELREILKKKYKIAKTYIKSKIVSKDLKTIKYLFGFEDFKSVEAVLMKYHYGYALCISTQVGCRMGCVFCATGKCGFRRNLAVSEMFSQVLLASKDAEVRISNVVLMGMGEPLDNYDNVLKFVEIITSQKGLNIGKRHVLISTCGLVDKIYKLIEDKQRLTLSVSLHAPNDRIRNCLIGINKRHSVDALLKACKTYSLEVKRRVTFVYTMIKNINDSNTAARELGKKLKNMSCMVNLVPFNAIEGSSLTGSTGERIQSFSKILMRNGLRVTIRRTLGSDIDASCGQLKLKSCT